MNFGLNATARPIRALCAERVNVKIPILESHKADLETLIGFVAESEVVFLRGFEVSEAQVFQIFGNVAIRILEKVEGGKVKRLRILNWSVEAC